MNGLLVTGGCGFIGSNFIRSALTRYGFRGIIVNLDLLTYAGNRDNLSDLVPNFRDQYVFVHGDINDRETLKAIFREYPIDTVVHFAAESHVDRSIDGPADFVRTNVLGTMVLLEEIKTFRDQGREIRIHHISTDEVFGSLEEAGYFNEATPYDPKSPYSATKAASDHMVRAFGHTYGIPYTISSCTNNYGPRQFPEKLVPLMILNLLNRKALPVYGDGKNIRDWIHVDDHNDGVWVILQKAKPGTTWLLGGENEWENIRLVKTLCRLVAEETGGNEKEYLDLITFVTDRPGHDRRYAIQCEPAKQELGWIRQHDFLTGLRETIRWYRENRNWVERIQTGAYKP